MSKKILKKISDKKERMALQRLINQYMLQEFNFTILDGHLDSLSLKYKNLNRIPSEIENFYFLRQLDLSRNNISSIEGLRSLQILEQLNFRENYITKIKDLEYLPLLRNLDLSQNQINNIEGLSFQPHLEVLNLNRNGIQEIKELDQCKNLRILNLNRNFIKKIQKLDKLTQLEELFLAYNKIDRIEGLENLKELKVLNLGLNQLDIIQGLGGNLYLENLNLSENRISKLENISHLLFIRKLNLTHNNFNPEVENIIQKSAPKIIEYCRIQVKKEQESLNQIETKNQKNNDIQKSQMKEELSFKTEILSMNGTTDVLVKKTEIESSYEKSESNAIIDSTNHFNSSETKDSLFTPNFSNKSDDDPNKEMEKRKLPRIKPLPEPKIASIQVQDQNKNQKPLAVPVPNPKILPVLDKNFTLEDDWMKFANELNQKEDYYNALLAFRNVIQLNTKNIDAWISSGIAFNNRDDYRRSIRAFKQAIAISAQHSKLWMYLGIGYYNFGEYDLSVKAFKESLDIDPENELSKTYLAKIPHEYKQSLKLLEKQAEYLAQQAQLAEDQLFKQMLKYSKAYQEITFKDLLPIVINPPYITDIPSLKHKISDLIVQQKINAKLFLDHLEFTTEKPEPVERAVIKIGDNFNIKQLLAFTNFSKLWLAEDLESKEKHVLKHIIFRGNYSNRKLIEHMALREIALLSKIKSSQVIPLEKSFLGEYQENFGYILQLPYYQFGTLDRKIKEVEEEFEAEGLLMNPYAILTIFTGMLQGIIPIHQAGIVHRDIKPSNIIINTNEEIPHPNDIIYIDFGIATAPAKITGTDFTIGGGCGTHGFSAPEQLKSPHVDYNADIYAIAATIYYTMTLTKYNGLFEIAEEIQDYYKKIEFIFPILKRMLNENPKVRMEKIEMLKAIVENLKMVIKRDVFNKK